MNFPDKIEHHLARFLSREKEEGQHISSCSQEDLEAALQVGDILLVDGNTRFSTVIRLLTQSAWSHSVILRYPTILKSLSPRSGRILIIIN